MCNNLNLKITHIGNQFSKSKSIVNKLFQIFIDRRFKYRVKGIDNSLSTDTTELSSKNVKYKKQRRSELDKCHG